MERRRFALSELRPNPFRDLDAHPLTEDELEALLDSFDRSGVWGDGRIIVRIRDGEPEVCFGHALVTSLMEHHSPDHEIEVIVEELTDEDMLRRMVDENEVRRQHSALADQEAVTAVVNAFAEGRISLEPPSKRTPNAKLRHAPSFRQGKDDQGRSPKHAYTTQTVAAFLDWDETRVRDTLRALELIEQGRVGRGEFKGMSAREARDLVRDLRRALRRAEGTAEEDATVRDGAEGEEDGPGAEKERGDSDGDAREEDDPEREPDAAGTPPEVGAYLDALEELVACGTPLDEILPDLDHETLDRIAALQAAALNVLNQRQAEINRLRNGGES